MKKQEIVDEDWDYLIVLDACRYDYFKKNYRNFLSGNLEPRWSAASRTAEWVIKNFTKPLDDIIYVSSNPFINGIGRPIEDITSLKVSWDAREYFKDVIDVWIEGWDKNTQTVSPEIVNRYVKRNVGRGRMIIHYMQPHQPYLSYKKNKWDVRNNVLGNKKSNNIIKDFLKSIRYFLKPFIKIINEKTVWRLMNLLGFKLDALRKHVVENRINELKELYEENLRIVLSNVSELVDFLEGKIVVTSDHGEAFGEYGEWGHVKGYSKNEVLRKVPWLVIEKAKSKKIKDVKIKKSKKETDIKNRRRRLGYLE